ncbi:MAG: hypothetical protein E7Z88_04550 [Cyanobacteria bacterium SIG27]|nr:hypothetical protein [Cyanobacteria bacterium SIG27]
MLDLEKVKKNLVSDEILEILKRGRIKGSYAIKSAGGAPHMPSLASMFCGEQIYPYFILDDDQDGRKYKSDIQKRNYYKDRVFTLKELVKKEYDKFTLEDLFPANIVNEFFNKKREKQFVLNEHAPFLAQILNQDRELKGDKEMLNDLKYELANKICNSITAQNIAESYPYLNELMLNIKTYCIKTKFCELTKQFETTTLKKSFDFPKLFVNISWGC